MSNTQTRAEHRTQTQTQRTHPKPGIRLTSTPRPTRWLNPRHSNIPLQAAKPRRYPASATPGMSEITRLPWDIDGAWRAAISAKTHVLPCSTWSR